MDIPVANLAEKFIHDHNNPVSKTEIPAVRRSLLPTNETASDDQYFNAITKILKHDRVERRCAQNRAVWLPQERIAKLTKVVGALLASYGFQNKQGRFLTAEETLLLVEINKLELVYENVSLSVLEAFKLILNDSLTFDKYQAYKKLSIQGYGLEIATEIEPESQNKKLKLDPVDNETMPDIFNKLQEKGPRLYQQEDVQPPEYVVSYPSTAGTSLDDFNLNIIRTYQEFSGKKCEDKVPTVFALCSDGVSFYKFTKIRVPNNPP